MKSRAFQSSWRPVLALSIAGLALSCVSQQQFQEQKDWALRYQRDFLNAQGDIARLEAENERLAVLAADGQIIDASSPQSEELQSRLAGLRQQLEQLGRPPGPIERFDVEGGYVYMIQDKVLFASGSYDVGNDGQSALKSLAQEIQGQAHGRVFIRGHTDNVPIVKPDTKARLPYGNIQLSAMRAVTVGSFLMSKGGIPADDIVVSGYGEWHPVAPNDSADNRRLNRRVEIFVEETE